MASHPSEPVERSPFKGPPVDVTSPLLVSHTNLSLRAEPEARKCSFFSGFVLVMIIAVVILVVWAALIITQPYLVEVNFVPLKSQIITNLTSVFDYNYNAAYVPIYDVSGNVTNALAVRCQNITGPTMYDVGPSYIALVRELSPGSHEFEHITMDRVIVAPDTEGDAFGAEDPRVQYLHETGHYYMEYTCVTDHYAQLRAQLCLATARDPLGPWTKWGPMLSNSTWWSKSGALFEDRLTYRTGDVERYTLLWGDMDISLARSNDLLQWDTQEVFIPRRSHNFDSKLVESGPPPMKLRSGTYLFLYNSGQESTTPNPKPNWSTAYNLGASIVSHRSKLLWRTKEIVFPWQCNEGLTPMVVFVEGMRACAPSERTNTHDIDSFIVYYAECDSWLSVGRIDVRIVNDVFWFLK